MTSPRSAIANRTSTSLLEGLHDAHDAEVWEAFDRRYRGLLTSFAMKLGLDDADAADVAQETLARFLVAYRDGRYDRSRGRLRSWLVSIAQGRIAALREHRATRRIDRGESAVLLTPDDAACDRLWDQARRQTILLQALEALRASSRLDERTLDAFELAGLRNLPPTAVAERLGMSVDEVYRAKSRVVARLREHVERLSATYDEDAA